MPIPQLPSPNNAMCLSCDEQRVFSFCCNFLRSILRMMWHTPERLATAARSLHRCAALASLILCRPRMQIVVLPYLGNSLLRSCDDHRAHCHRALLSAARITCPATLSCLLLSRVSADELLVVLVSSFLTCLPARLHWSSR